MGVRSFARTGDAVGRRLEEELRSWRGVNHVIKLGGALRLALARFLTALIRHARRPHFLKINRGEQGHIVKRPTPAAIVNKIYAASPELARRVKDVLE